MKRLAVALVVLLTSSAWIFSAPKAAITIRVVDETGAPIRGVPVRLSTYSHTVPSADFGRDIWEGITKMSDTNGAAAFVLRSRLKEVGYDIYPDPAGYYNDYGGEYHFQREDSGRWEPWNPTVQHVLKRITDPVAMHVRYFGRAWSEKLPAMEQPVGFDLMKSDWVKPFGKGDVPDFIFWLKVEHIPNPPDWDERKSGIYHLYRAEFRLSFSNEGDGLQPFCVQLRTGSYLTSPSVAPESGYTNAFVRTAARLSPTHYDGEEDREEQNYIFRVRSVMKDGKVARACYGKIYGNIQYALDGEVRFLYYLNPDPTSRSLEFDTKRNLYTPEKGETYSPGP